MSVTVDTADLRAFSVDVTNMPASLTRHLTPVLTRAGVNVKRGMREDLGQSSNAGIRHVAQTVGFDVQATTGGLEVEVGPSKPSGALANVAYFGTPKGGGHTRAPEYHLQDEAPRFERALGDLVEEVWGG